MSEVIPNKWTYIMRRLMAAALVILFLAASVLLALRSQVLFAENVERFYAPAFMKCGPGGGPYRSVQLRADGRFGVGGRIENAFSIKAGDVCEITVLGKAATPGAEVGVELVDEDHFLRFADDVLDEYRVELHLDQTSFEAVLELQCGYFSEEIIGRKDRSGEQTAEIYVRDGALRLPPNASWEIACDKIEFSSVPRSGGTITIPWANDAANAVIPDGALVEETLVTLSNALPIPNPDSVPPGLLPISEALKIGPDSLVLSVPANVTLPYTDGEIEGYDESRLNVLKFNASTLAWEVIPSTVDTPTNRLYFDIGQFGIYGFSGPGPAGGKVEFLAGGSGASANIAAGSGLSLPYAALASGAAALVLAIGAGGWYARIRLGRKRRI